MKALALETEIRIKKAFIDSINDHGLNRLTVTTLIKRAQINRSTFYSHYLDKYDLTEKLEKKLLDDFAALMEHRLEDSMTINLDKKNGRNSSNYSKVRQLRVPEFCPHPGFNGP
nr:TetR/AcrR family transcriptional regulator [Secundilactobacillus kimchicus]